MHKVFNYSVVQFPGEAPLGLLQAGMEALLGQLQAVMEALVRLHLDYCKQAWRTLVRPHLDYCKQHGYSDETPLEPHKLAWRPWRLVRPHLGVLQAGWRTHLRKDVEMIKRVVHSFYHLHILNLHISINSTSQSTL